MLPPGANPIALAILGFLVIGVTGAVLTSWAFLLVRAVQGMPILPRVAKPPVPWGPWSVLAALGLWFLCQNLAMVVYVLVRKSVNPGVVIDLKSISIQDLLLVGSLANLASSGLIIALLRKTSNARPADLGLSLGDAPGNVLRGMVACFVLLPPVYGVMVGAVKIWAPKAHPVDQMIRQGASPGTAALALFAAVIAAPLTEELLFRGVLLGWLWKLGGRTGPISPVDPEGILVLEGPESEPIEIGELPDEPALGLIDPWTAPQAAIVLAKPEVREVSEIRGFLANVVTSVIFAGLHYQQWPAPLALFVLSLGLGHVYRRTGSLWAPIALHATFNGLSTTLMLLSAASGALPYHK